MDVPPASLLRRLVVGAALLVPLVADPAGLDPLTLKRATLALVGLAALALEAGEVLVARRALVRPSWAETWLLLLALWAGVSLSWATNPWVGVLGVLMLLGMVGVARTVRASPGLEAWWLGGLLAVGLATALVDGLSVLARRPLMEAGAEKYASGLFVHTNMGALYGVLLLPLAVAGLASARRPAARAAWLAPLALLGAWLVVLRSRTGVLGALLGVGLVLALLALRRRVGRLRSTRRPVLVAAVLVVGACSVLPFSDRARGLAKDGFYRGVTALQALGVGSLDEIGFRPDVFTKTIQLAREQPLRGVGHGNFPVEYPRLERHLEDRPHGHNDALHLLAELGAPGLLLFLAWLVALALALGRAVAATSGTAAYPWAAGLCGTWLAFVLSGLSEVPFTQGASGLVVAVLTGLVARLAADPLVRWHPGRALATGLLVVAAAGMVWVARQLPASSLAAEGARARAEGDVQAAAAAFRSLASLRTGAHEPQEELSRLALVTGDLPEARQRIRAARRLAPHRVDLAQHEGVVLLELGRADEAVALFSQAVQAKPGDLHALFQLVHALDVSGRRQEAIERLEYLVQSRRREIDLDAVIQLADLWRRHAEELEGDEQVEALVAARHFHAVVLQDGSVDEMIASHDDFKHLTHRLQVLQGSPDSWWPVYESFLKEGGWIMPQTALYTALDGDGRKLYPGWEEPAGPPLPPRMRNR